MSLRTRLHTPSSPAPPQPDTPAAHYADPLEEEGARNIHKHARNESLPRLTARGVAANANGNGAGNGSAAGKGQDEEPYDKLRKKNRFVPGQKVWIVIAAVLGVILLAKLVAREFQWACERRLSVTA